MGRIKEERKKKKRQRLMYMIAAGVGGGALLITGVLVLTLIIGNAISGGPAVGTENSQIASSNQSTQNQEPENSTTETGNTESQDSEIQNSNSQEPESQEPEPQQLQIVMVGDMLIHDKIITSGKKTDGTYNFDHLFTHVTDYIQAADIAIVNQETIMGGEKFGYSGYPRFNSPYEIADAEVKAGFNVILHATNHTTDKGKEAVLNCMNYWDTKYPDIAYLGINKTQEEQDNNIFVFEQNGIKVAILNYTYVLNGNRMPSDMPYLVNLMTKGVSEKRVIADIKKAEELADFTIVCPHWGTEYSLKVSSTQKHWTKIFLENGVDLVLGAHPHVIEPIEWVTDDNGNKMLVYYSLGNYVNGTSSTKGDLAHRMVGGIADVTIGRDENGEVVILENDVVPIVCHMAEGEAYTVYYLKDYTEELAKENRICLQDSEFSLQACLDVVRQVWGE
ncbi:MAG: CapA family protein [Agathobacter sp.]|nr:CapA family protein [Agathobacter sp.]